MKRLVRIAWESTVMVILIGNLAAIASYSYSEFVANAQGRPPVYDPTLTRVCPNDNCRHAVVDQPVTRCPVCWSELPVYRSPFGSSPALPADYMSDEWAARHRR